jgi:hypothetical protein
MNDGLPEKPDATATGFLSLGHWLLCLNYAPCRRVRRRVSTTRLKQGRKLLDLRSPAGEMTFPMGCTEFSVGTGEAGRFAQQAKSEAQIPHQILDQ